jgi:hypothetical protein
MREKISKTLAAAAGSIVLFATMAGKVLAQSSSDYLYSTTSDAASSAVFGGFTLVWCCVALVGLAVWLGVTYWVYKDAKKNNPEQAMLWTLVTLVAGVVGLIVYLLAGRKKA